MNYQDVIDCITEHITKLYANPYMYEDGTYNIIHALEELVIPALEKEIPKPVFLRMSRGGDDTCHHGCPNCCRPIKYEGGANEEACYPERCGRCGQVLEWD